MTLSAFDPFRNRLARDIRNSLSRSFLRALAEKDASVFQKCGADYLRQDLPPDLAGYVKGRLRKYEEAFGLIAGNMRRQILPQAEILWDLALYFEMHELLETAWQKAAGNKRRALQGLIRAAGVKIHAENMNMRAAASMGAKALADLEQHGDELAGFTRLGAVVAAIEQILAAGPDGQTE